MSGTGRRIVKRVVEKVYNKVNPHYQSEIVHRDKIIADQVQTIAALSDRNEEWAREVRELRHENDALHIILPVTKKDLFKAVIGKKHKRTIRKSDDKSATPTVSWVIPPMGPVSGGHTTIFRTIQGLENNGYVCKVYVYDAQNTTNVEEIKSHLVHFPAIKAEVVYNAKEIDNCDILFATNWHTAYPVYNSNATQNKHYFIQDFEPMFDPVGSYSTFADNTYKFGFHGITLGNWMKEKLVNEYGMSVDNFDLRVNSSEYHLDNTKQRKAVCFYARPVTPRRGFEIGILALEQFHNKHPEYEIHLVGWDVSKFDDINFEYVNHGIIDTDELNDVYNKSAAGLVLSFTNMSLLPLEMMAAGCIPVVNNADHTRDVGYSKYIEYAEPTPTELAEGLYNAILKADDAHYIKSMNEFTSGFSWSDYDKQLSEILRKTLKN